MKLTELLRKRSSLAAKSAELAAKASEVSAELERVDAELFSRMKSLVVAIEGGDSEDRSEEAQEPVALGAQTAPAPSVKRILRRRSSGLGKQIVAALRDVGRPMDRNELLTLLATRGVTVPGKDPKANLSAHLSYSSAVERTADGLWALKITEGVS
jgi:hypothetical protein